jgi:hypothetical protein
MVWVTTGSLKFYICDSWWLQDIPGTLRNRSSVLYIEFLLFGEREMEKEKTKPKKIPLPCSPAWQLAATVPRLLGLFLIMKS